MNLKQNKENTIAFYRMAYEGQSKEVIEKYIGRQYIQHNLDVVDGTQESVDYFERIHVSIRKSPLNLCVA